jgi:anti-anti-sigma regulatory factor
MSLVIPPRLRLPEAMSALQQLRHALASGAHPQVLDLAVLNDSDSSALAVLLALKREFGFPLPIHPIGCAAWPACTGPSP